MAAKGSKNSLGIFISPKEICIAQVRAGKGKPELEHLVKFPTGFTVKEGMLRPLSLNNEFFSEKASWLAPFAQAMKQVSWSGSSAVVSLSPQFAILRYFVMPVVDRKFWAKSIPLESKKYIPVSFDEVVYDYDVAPVDGGKKLGVLFGLTQRKSVEFLINTLKASGLSLASMEIAPASMERLFAFIDSKDHASKGYIHFSAGYNYMVFSHGGLPVLYRETETDGAGAMAGRRLDIKGAVQFVDRYVGAGSKYSDIRLSGDSADTWKPVAEKEAETIPASLWDPAAACGLKDSTVPAMFAVGAGLKDKIGLLPSLDISGLSAAARVEQDVQRSIWAITGIIGGLLLILILIGQFRLMGLNSQLAALESQVAAVPELQNSSSDEIRTRIDTSRAAIQVIQRATTGGELVAPKLAALLDALPQEAWLSGVKMTLPFQLADKQPDMRDFYIMCETFLTGERKTYVGESYLKALRLAPEYKTFVPPRGTMEFALVTGQANTTAVGPFMIVGKGKGNN